MSYRFMRIIIFFDLPIETAQDRREYSRFHKYLVKNGFLMMQKSVYCKLALNQTSAGAILDNLRRSKPPSGLIQALTITEKQYSKTEFILGKYEGDIVTSDERYIEL